MTYESPPRLKQGDEFGELLRAGDVVDVSADRLASNAAGYKTLIAAGAIDRAVEAARAARAVVRDRRAGDPVPDA